MKILRVLKENKKNKEMEKYKDFKSYDSALKCYNKLKNKYKKHNIKLVAIPSKINVGDKIYRNNGELYGTIKRETPSFYYIEPNWKEVKDELDWVIFLKDNFNEKYEKEIFKIIDLKE